MSRRFKQVHPPEITKDLKHENKSINDFNEQNNRKLSIGNFQNTRLRRNLELQKIRNFEKFCYFL